MDVHQMWLECSNRTLRSVAQENGLTRQALVALFDLAGLTGRRAADPSASEIAVAARRIRSNWTPEVERQRWIAAKTPVGII
jgi:hypothetical protein